MEHIEGVWLEMQDPEVVRFTGTHTKFTREQVEDWTAKLAGRDDRADYAILRASDRAYVGDAGLQNLDADNRSMSFRIALAEPGRGYGTEATRLVLDYAFDVVGVHRVTLEVFDFNKRAQRVYEKCGFIREGLQREALYWDGQWHDTIDMAVLAGDPRG
jgi:RimJ/RimL family protein N-acetyltransferase